MIESIGNEFNNPIENTKEYSSRLNEFRKKVNEMYIEGKINKTDYGTLNNMLLQHEKKIKKQLRD
jgi:hypothetical protein